MTLAGNNTGLCVFLGKPKFIYYRPLKTTPVHSPTSFLQYPPKVPRPQILLWGVFSRVSVTHLETDPLSRIYGGLAGMQEFQPKS